jgi:hypothetical protein
VVPVAKADEGVSVAVAPETLIVAATFVDPAWSVNVEDVNVAPAIARLNVAETVLVVATPVAPDAGDWLTITGGVAAAVVKDHVAGPPKATPLVSVTVPAILAV